MADDDDPFRRPAHARSVALERLAARHPDAELIHTVDTVDDLDAIGAALGDPPPAGCLMTFGYVATLAVAAAWLVSSLSALWLGVGGAVIVVGHVSLAIGRARWRRRVARALAWLDGLPFPVTGARGFFAATEPMLDVSFRAAPALADFAAGVRAYAPTATVTAIAPATFRLRWPIAGKADDGEPPAGPPRQVSWLRRFLDEVVVPLHADLGVERVELGGTRALPPPVKPPPAR